MDLKFEFSLKKESKSWRWIVLEALQKCLVWCCFIMSSKESNCVCWGFVLLLFFSSPFFLFYEFCSWGFEPHRIQEKSFILRRIKIKICRNDNKRQMQRKQGQHSDQSTCEGTPAGFSHWPALFLNLWIFLWKVCLAKHLGKHNADILCE